MDMMEKVGNAARNSNREPCTRSTHVMGTMTVEMWQKKLHPTNYKAAANSESVAKAYASANAVISACARATSFRGKCGTRGCTICTWVSSGRFRGGLVALLENGPEVVEGLCLDCIRTGTETDLKKASPACEHTPSA
jgi:hypothetical protein